MKLFVPLYGSPHFCTPTYLAQLSLEEGLALSQAVAKSMETGTQGVLRLIRQIDPPWLRAGKPKRRRGTQGKDGAAPMQGRVEEVLAWVRRVMERPGEEDVFTTALALLKRV